METWIRRGFCAVVVALTGAGCTAPSPPTLVGNWLAQSAVPCRDYWLLVHPDQSFHWIAYPHTRDSWCEDQGKRVPIWLSGVEARVDRGHLALMATPKGGWRVPLRSLAPDRLVIGDDPLVLPPGRVVTFSRMYASPPKQLERLEGLELTLDGLSGLQR